MAWITEKNKEHFIEMMATHYKRNVEDVRKEVEKNPEALEGFVDYLTDIWNMKD